MLSKFSMSLILFFSSFSLFAAPTQTLIRSEYAPQEITTLCQQAIENNKATLDQIGSIAPASRSLDTTLLAFEKTMADLSDAVLPLTFMGYVHGDKSLRDEGFACEEKLGEYMVGVFTRKDLYDSIKDLRAKTSATKRLLTETKKAFERNGLKLAEDQLAAVKKLKSELAVKESQFAKLLNGDTSTVSLDEKNLTGVPANVLKEIKKTSDGKYAVPAFGPLYQQVMENCSNEETRRLLNVANFNRGGAQNIALLEDAIVLRQKTAKLMGFKDWADYRIDGRMAKDGATVLNFLGGLRGKLKQRNDQDLAKLLAFKKTLDPSATQINPWDINYLAYQLKKRDYSLDNDVIRQYFPADLVVKGMFDLYSQLFSIKFIPAPHVSVWAPKVYAYEIRDTKTGELLSYFFTDFFPREGKYSHAAAFNLISGRLLNTVYSVPVSSIVSNFNPPTADKPALWNHDEVETLFHEFGHIVHQTITRAPYASLSGSSVAQDFVESISQIMENWVWEPKVLNKISGHYLDPNKKLPKEIVTKMLAAKDFNQGYFYTRQLFLGSIDMAYHTAQEPVNTDAVTYQLYKEIIGINPVEGAHFQGSFGHLMGGYDSGYYGYLWSEVYADDMFTKFSGKNLFNSNVGRKFRRVILAQGNMKENMILLKEFLGREPSNKAFFAKLGINTGR